MSMNLKRKKAEGGNFTGGFVEICQGDTIRFILGYKTRKVRSTVYKIDTHLMNIAHSRRSRRFISRIYYRFLLLMLLLAGSDVGFIRPKILRSLVPWVIKQSVMEVLFNSSMLCLWIGVSSEGTHNTSISVTATTVSGSTKQSQKPLPRVIGWWVVWHGDISIGQQELKHKSQCDWFVVQGETQDSQ